MKSGVVVVVLVGLVVGGEDALCNTRFSCWEQKPLLVCATSVDSVDTVDSVDSVGMV